MLQMSGAGGGPEPHMPQVDAVKVAPAAAAGNDGATVTPKAPGTLGPDRLLRCGVLIDALNLRPLLEVHFWDAKGRREATDTKAAYACALAQKEVLVKRCEEAEAGLKELTEATKTRELARACRDSELAMVEAEQVTENEHRETLLCEVVEAWDAHAKHVSKARARLVANRAALSSLDLTARQTLGSICRLKLESSLIPQDVVYVELSSELVKELEGTIKKVDNALEE
ncbi:hypothetical protein ZWY2020_052476 [Hordeum vulgare]|nr:hypothetical protein ZWY2020_052476 [Hordeum vulgare]